MTDLWIDLRYAARTLWKSPLFTAVAVLSLALGIGANTAIFTLLDQVILRLLPVKNPKELVLLTSHGEHYGSNQGSNALSFPMYEDFRDHNAVFNGMFCRYPFPASLSIEGRTERVKGELVSGTYFQVLGVGAALGRVITPDDDKTPDGHPLVMLSHAYWKSRFAADPAILNTNLLLNGRSLTVIGVVQAGFAGMEPGTDAQIFVPVMMKAEMTPMSAFDDLKNRRSRWINVFGRLKPGTSREQAKAGLQPYYHSLLEMEVTQKEFNDASPYVRQQFLRSTMDLLPGSQGRPSLRRQFERPLWVLMALVGVVLLIACANIANLLLARAASRQKENAVRMALGAGRLRIMRQLMVESVLLAVIGGGAGLLLATWADGVLLGLLPQGSSPLPINAAPDLRILAFNFVIALFTGILFGLAPALQTTRPDLAPTLKDQAGAVLGGGGPANLRKALVVAQVTLSLLLLFGAGLFVRSLRNLRGLHPGFSTNNLVAFAVDPSLNKYPLPRVKSFYHQLTDNLHSVPGVKAAGFGMIGLMEGNEWDSTVTVEGYEAKPGEDMNPYFNGISPGYFAAMGIPILAGRDFTINDSEMVPSKVFPFPLPTKVMVNRKFAQFFFKDRPAVGRHIGFGGDPNTPANMEIIGVVADAKYTGMRDDIPRQVFIPYLASPLLAEMTGYVRTESAPEQAYAVIRNEVRKLDPNLPIYNLRTLESKIDESLLNERLIATLSSVFGFLATALALIGLYGVMAYTVARRTREIGIRMALGASTKKVVWMVMREVLLLVGIGIACGLPAAWGLARLVESQLYGVPAHDPVTMIAATAALAIVACLSGYLPARRASRVHPTTALRYE